jgi:hypothetical protein
MIDMSELTEEEYWDIVDEVVYFTKQELNCSRHGDGQADQVETVLQDALETLKQKPERYSL